MLGFYPKMGCEDNNKRTRFSGRGQVGQKNEQSADKKREKDCSLPLYLTLNYMNFIHFTIKLFRANPKSKKRVAELEREILAVANIADVGWIKEKLEELKKGLRQPISKA